jgi:hypothetical protein
MRGHPAPVTLLPDITTIDDMVGYMGAELLTLFGMVLMNAPDRWEGLPEELRPKGLYSPDTI